jgi:hypothetical protein
VVRFLICLLLFSVAKAQVFIPFGMWRGNGGPTITAIASRNVYQGNLTNIPFQIGHKSGYPLYCSGISLTATSSNVAAVPLSAISFVGTFPFCFMNINTPTGATGASNITVTVSDTGSPILQASTTFTATVYTVTGLTVTPTTQIIPQNSSFQFTAMATYSDSTTQNVSPSAVWTPTLLTGTAPSGLTSNLGLITVTTVTGYPTYSYTATYGGFSSTVNILFNSSTINGMFTTPISGNINVAGTTDIKCYVTTVDGGSLDFTSVCNWTSNNNPIANVNNFSNKGRVYGNALGGPVTITATYGIYTDTTAITVNASAPAVVEEGTGLYARYYLAGSVGGPKSDPYITLVTARLDANVDFAWGSGSNPAGGANNFGGRWSGQITAPTSATYCIQTSSDDGVRVWIGNTLVINNWTDHGTATDNGSYTFVANIKTEIFAEFYEQTGGAEMHIRYNSGACPGASTPIPRINLFPIATRALDIQQDVVPQWTGLRRGFTMNGTVGSIANSAVITGFTNGAATPVNAVASNVNGTGMAYANSERSQTIGFDGVDDSISVAASTVIAGTANRSTAAWVNPTSIGAQQDVLGYGTSGALSMYGIRILSTGAVRVYGGTASFCDTAASVIPFAQWSHIVTTYTAGTALIYVNGTLRQTCTSLAWNTTAASTLYIGAGTGLTNLFSGFIDDVAFWNLILSVGEINSLYEKQRVINL